MMRTVKAAIENAIAFVVFALVVVPAVAILCAREVKRRLA